MRLNTVVLAPIVLLLASLLSGGTAWAHDPDWKKREGGDAKPHHDHPKTSPRAESEKWPDPFIEERKWGPITVGAAGGVFVPWQGDGGHAVTGNVMVSSPSGHFRLGGEVLYRSYESRIFDVEDVDVDSYEVNFVFHYLFNPDGITPYVGAATGFNINKVRKTEVQDARPDVRVTDDIGVGWGLAALAGFEIPLIDHLAVYGEARVGLAFQATSEDDDRRNRRRRHGYNRRYDDDYDTEDIGGATGVIGFRYKF